VKALDLYVAHQLEQARLRYEQGNKSELLRWMNWCFIANREVPSWIKEGISKAVNDADTYKIRTWNDVFGKPVPKGTHLKTARRNSEIEWDLFWRVCGLHKAGRPIDENLFEKVGKEFGIKKTLASKLYYEFADREFGDLDKGSETSEKI
jgi:hypothetical protein